MGNSKAKYQAQETAQREATARANAQHSYNMQLQREATRRTELANKHKLLQQQATARMEQQKRDHQMRLEAARSRHEQSMKALENAKIKAARDARIQQKKDAISNITQQINEYGLNITKYKKDLSNCIDKSSIINEKLNGVNNKLLKFNDYKDAELSKLATNIGYLKAKNEFERNENLIESAIETTGVMPPNVHKFLVLINGLRRANLVGAEYNNKLSNDITTFGEILSRECTDKFSVEAWFQDQGLDRLIPILNEEDIKYMDDIKCNDEEEYSEIMDIVKNGIKKQYNDWLNKKNKAIMLKKNDDDNDEDDIDDDNIDADEIDSNDDDDNDDDSKNDKNEEEPGEIEKEPKKTLTFMEKRKLKAACLNAEETWGEAAEQKTEATKETLEEICGPMAKFFERIDGTVKQARNLLTYSKELTSQQKKAIEFAQNQKLLAIKSNNSDNNDNDSKIDNDNIDNDNKLKNEIIKYDNPIAKDCDLLNKAAIISIDVVKSMEDDFDDDGNLGRAKGMAISVEQNCLQIIESQGEIRKSLILGDSILALKPANIESPKAKKLWNSVDKGIVLIYKNALNMVKISGKFFSFFLKFRQSFQYYLSHSDKKLVVSLAHLRKDIKEFDKFREKLNKEIKKLDDAAMKCITNCVHTAIGASAYDDAAKSRAKLRETYLDKKKIYDKKSTELDAEYDILMNEKIDLAAKSTQYKYQIDSLNKSIENDSMIINELNASKKKIQEIIVD